MKNSYPEGHLYIKIQKEVKGGAVGVSKNIDFRGTTAEVTTGAKRVKKKLSKSVSCSMNLIIPSKMPCAELKSIGKVVAWIADP